MVPGAVGARSQAALPGKGAGHDCGTAAATRLAARVCQRIDFEREREAPAALHVLQPLLGGGAVAVCCTYVRSSLRPWAAQADRERASPDELAGERESQATR